MLNDFVPVCGRCGSIVQHERYEATFGYGSSSGGCQSCFPGIRSDEQRRVDALLALEQAAAAALSPTGEDT